MITNEHIKELVSKYGDLIRVNTTNAHQGIFYYIENKNFKLEIFQEGNGELTLKKIKKSFEINNTEDIFLNMDRIYGNDDNKENILLNRELGAILGK